MLMFEPIIFPLLVKHVFFFLFLDTPQEKVINIVPEDLLSPSTEAAPLVNKDAQADLVKSPRTIK